MLISVLLLAPIAFGAIIGYRRSTRPPNRLGRLAVTTVLVERAGLVGAVWLAAFTRPLWVLSGAALLVAVTRSCLRQIGKRAERAVDERV